MYKICKLLLYISSRFTTLSFTIPPKKRRGQVELYQPQVAGSSSDFSARTRSGAHYIPSQVFSRSHQRGTTLHGQAPRGNIHLILQAQPSCVLPQESRKFVQSAFTPDTAAPSPDRCIQKKRKSCPHFLRAVNTLQLNSVLTEITAQHSTAPPAPPPTTHSSHQPTPRHPLDQSAYIQLRNGVWVLRESLVIHTDP